MHTLIIIITGIGIVIYALNKIGDTVESAHSEYVVVRDKYLEQKNFEQLKLDIWFDKEILNINSDNLSKDDAYRLYVFRVSYPNHNHAHLHFYQQIMFEYKRKNKFSKSLYM